jgi:uncharacterized membrane protein
VSRSKTITWAVMTLMAFGIGLYALGFFLIPEMGSPSFKSHFETIPWTARLHIVPGGLALIVGAFQFHSGLRRRWTNIHRYTGRAYVILVLTGAVGGLLLAWYAPRSPATRLGFASLAIIWFYSASMAYFAVRAGNIALHQQWMVRSYALTLAAVTLRIQLGIYQDVMGLSFDESYAIVAWFAWIPNLIIAEWVFNQAPIRKSTAEV